MDRVVPLIAAVIFGGVGAVICIGVATALLREREKRATGLVTRGTVVEIRKDNSLTDDIYFYPLVEYRTGSGQTVRFEGSSRTTPSRYKVGDAVEVMYHPDAPSSAEIAGGETATYVLVLLFLGIPGVIIGLGVLVRCVILGLCGPVQ